MKPHRPLLSASIKTFLQRSSSQYSSEKLSFNLSEFKIMQVIENLQGEQLTSSPSTGGLSISTTGSKVDVTFRDDFEQGGQSTLRPQSHRTVCNSVHHTHPFCREGVPNVPSLISTNPPTTFYLLLSALQQVPIELPQTHWRITLCEMLEAVWLSIQTLLVKCRSDGAST